MCVGSGSSNSRPLLQASGLVVLEAKLWTVRPCHRIIKEKRKLESLRLKWDNQDLQLVHEVFNGAACPVSGPSNPYDDCYNDS